jgi:hypothetical protein
MAIEAVVHRYLQSFAHLDKLCGSSSLGTPLTFSLEWVSTELLPPLSDRALHKVGRVVEFINRDTRYLKNNITI